jgi:hypothetical protein
MKHLKLFEDYTNESIIGGIAIATVGLIALDEVYKFFKKIYIRNINIPDERAFAHDDKGALEVIQLYIERIKLNIKNGGNANIEAFDKDNDLIVYSSSSGKKSELFRINKTTSILTSGFSKTKIRLSESQLKDFQNLIHWYKK